MSEAKHLWTKPLDRARLTGKAAQFADFCLDLGAGYAVARRLVLPETLPRETLPHLCLLTREGRDWIVALAGGDVASRYGAPLKGRKVSEIFTGESVAVRLARYEAAAAERCFSADEVAYDRLGVRVRYLRILQPLTDDGGAVRWLLLYLELTGGLPHRALSDPEVERFAEALMSC